MARNMIAGGNMSGDRITAVLPLILVAMLVAFTFWLDRLVQPIAKPGASVKRHDPDYLVDGLSARRMNPAGATAYTLSARKMVHYPDDDTTLLTDPRLVSLGADGNAPITITSRQALVSSNGENVYFQDDVHVTRAAFGNASEMQMRTSYLHVIPDDNIAKTDRPVTITDDSTKVTASGLELDSDALLLKLSGRVHGVYDPAKAPPRDSKR
jgi:lipopolysaccharide export system protein LptC